MIWIRHLLLLFSFFISCYGHAQVLQNDTEITIRSNGEKKVERTIKIYIGNPKMANMTNVRIQHSVDHPVVLDYAFVYNANGELVKKVSKKNLITKSVNSSSSFYQDDLETSFSLFWNAYPYTIKYKYKQNFNQYINIAYWDPALYYGVKTMKGSLTVHMPEDFGYQCEVTDSVKSTNEVVEGLRTLRWEVTDRLLPMPELFGLDPSAQQATVHLTPDEFVYGGEAGSHQSWGDFGDWITRLNHYPAPFDRREAHKVRSMIDSCSSARDKIRVLYHYLQQSTVYVNVSIKEGGLKSYPANYVVKNKYGDCKALTTYMKAMLAQAGIPSYYALVAAGAQQPEISTEFPSQQFNHVILCVPMQKDTLWLENTSTTSPFNYLGTFTQGRYSLLVDGQNSKLVKTPAIKGEGARNEVQEIFSLDEQGEWQVAAEITLRGGAFETVNHYFKRGKVPQFETYVKKRFNLKIKKFARCEVADSPQDAHFMKVLCTAKVPIPITSIGESKYLRPPKILLPAFEVPSKRDRPVLLNMPIEEHRTSVYQLPEGEELTAALPEDFIKESKYGHFHRKYHVTARQLVVESSLAIYRGKISLTDYPDFYAFIKSINKYQQSTYLNLL